MASAELTACCCGETTTCSCDVPSVAYAALCPVRKSRPAINNVPVKTRRTDAVREKSVLLYLQVLETKGDVDGLDELCAWFLCELCGNRSCGSCCCRANSRKEVGDASQEEEVCFAGRAGACRVRGAPCAEGAVSSFCFTERR